MRAGHLCRQCRGSQNRMRLVNGRPVWRACRKRGGNGVTRTYAPRTIQIHSLAAQHRLTASNGVAG